MLSLGIALLTAAAAAAPATTCESLQSMSTPQVAVTVQAMPAGPFIPLSAAPTAAAAAPRAGGPGRAGGAPWRRRRCPRIAA